MNTQIQQNSVRLEEKIASWVKEDRTAGVPAGELPPWERILENWPGLQRGPGDLVGDMCAAIGLPFDAPSQEFLNSFPSTEKAIVASFASNLIADCVRVLASQPGQLPIMDQGALLGSQAGFQVKDIMHTQLALSARDFGSLWVQANCAVRGATYESTIANPNLELGEEEAKQLLSDLQQLVAENSEAITKADLDSIMYQINGEDKLVVLVTPAFVEMTLTQVEGVARINGHELKGEAYERLNRFGDPVDKVFVDWLKDNVLDFDGGGKSPSIFAKDGQILQHLLAVEPIAACYREVDYNLSQYIVSPSTSRAIDELFSKQMKFRECCKAAEVSLDAAIDAFASLGKIQLGLQRSGEMNAAEMRAAISTLLNIVRDAAERPDVSIVDTLEIAIVQDLAKGYVQLLDPKSARLDPTRDVHAFGAVLSAPGQTVV